MLYFFVVVFSENVTVLQNNMWYRIEIKLKYIFKIAVGTM